MNEKIIFIRRSLALQQLYFTRVNWELFAGSFDCAIQIEEHWLGDPSWARYLCRSRTSACMCIPNKRNNNNIMKHGRINNIDPQ